MRVLLTGGTGFVGSALREELKARGHEVVLLVRNLRARSDVPREGFALRNGDVLDRNACLQACDGCDAVIHLVGIIREYPRRGVTFEQLHVQATENVLYAAARQGVKRFIHMSALGSREGARSRYHRTKYEAESKVRRAGVDWTIFRPSVIFAPGDDFTGMLADLAARKFVPLVEGGRSLLQPVALEDVVRCMADSLLMPETREETYELGGADRMSLRDMLEAVAAHLGIKIKTVNVPAFAMKLVVRMMESRPDFPLTGDQLLMLLEDNVCDMRHASETFGFEPASFRKALPGLLNRIKDAATGGFGVVGA
jgi:NADH dehydrogenase